MNRRVAFQGERGAFSEDACHKFLPKWEPVATPSFAAVGAAVCGREAALGMLPLQNNVAGPVPGVAALVERLGLTILSRHLLPVHLHLLAVPGTNLATIKRIISHPMALAQCSRWLSLADCTTEDAENTAGAARSLAQNGDPTCAVIASDRAARLYGLQILAQNIQDRADNETLFVVVTKQGDLT